MSALEVIGALWVVALLDPAVRRVPSWPLLSPLWTAAAVCVSHAASG
ncbi:hypothetical protein [Streptomyces sp. R02]|uniref:Prepilin peptidase n=1 Tax=Streptomyces sp. R02 TaxID=3238623 RepID=A0AB39LEF4_9ACTN